MRRHLRQLMRVPQMAEIIPPPVETPIEISIRPEDRLLEIHVIGPVDPDGFAKHEQTIVAAIGKLTASNPASKDYVVLVDLTSSPVQSQEFLRRLNLFTQDPRVAGRRTAVIMATSVLATMQAKRTIQPSYHLFEDRSSAMKWLRQAEI